MDDRLAKTVLLQGEQILQLRSQLLGAHGMFVCAIQALVASHPDPEEFKKQWDANIAGIWTATAGLPEHAVPGSDTMKTIQSAIELAMKRG